MTDQQTNNSAAAPSGSPASPPAGGDTSSTGGNFVRDRVSQMQRQAAQPQGEQGAGDQRQQQTQQQTAAERMVRIGENDYPEARLTELLTKDAEAQSRKLTLPKSENDYQIKNSDNFRLPEGVKFEWDQNNPALAGIRRFAHAQGWDQATLSSVLDYYASSKFGELTSQQRARQQNLDSLGPAGPQRIEAVATWLQARAGADGRAMAETLRRYPAASFVRAYEALIKQFSSGGAADFSQSHRAGQEDNSGRIPGYSSMTFQQIRAHQMAQQMNKPGYRGGGRGER